MMAAPTSSHYPQDEKRHEAEERARLKLSTIAAAAAAIGCALALIAEVFLKH
jgi:hypothetical protein